MNAATGTNKDGSRFLLIVLEPGNVHKLQKGQPMHFRIEDMFPDGIPRKLEVVIAHSETPIGDGKKLAEIADVALDERTPQNENRRPHCPECRSTIEELGVWRNESLMALAFCAQCGCTLGMVPQEVVKALKP